MNEEESMADTEDKDADPAQGEWVPGKHVLHALMMLMQDVTDIPKTGTAPPEAGGYKFRGIELTIENVGRAARTYGMALQPEVLRESYVTHERPGKLWTSCRLVMRYTFTSLEDGSKFPFEAAGEGRDTADKATSKAMSMALKYALGQALLIGTGDDDPDGERPEIPAQEPTQAAPQRGNPQQANPEEQAKQALSAAQTVSTRTELTKIRTQAEQENLLDVSGPDGTTLLSRLTVIYHTLPEGT